MGSMPGSSLFRRVLEEGFNQGNLAVVDEVFAAGYHAHIFPYGAPNGPQGFKWLIAMFRTAFPDLLCTLAEEIYQGDWFSGHWMMQGTQQGMFMGNQPTGRQVEIQGIMFAHLRDGHIIEDWLLIDQMGIFQQLGVVPPMVRKER